VLSPELLGLDEVVAAAQGGSALADGDYGPGAGGFRRAKELLIAAWERQYLGQLLRRSGGNVSRAARQGRLDRVYLHRLIKKYNLAVDLD
jgi:transcriptional regulator of acetoin/glycerol metabolism